MRWGNWLLAIFLMVLATIRVWSSWVNGQELQDGSEVIVRTKIGFNVREKWGNQYLVIQPGVGRTEMEIEIPEANKIRFGDKVEIIGTIKQRVIGNNEVRNRLIIRHIYVSPGVSNLGRVVVDFRIRCEKIFRGALGGDEAELLAGIVLGNTGRLSDSAQEDFRRVGLAHVIAASGYNVGILMAWIVGIGSVIHRKYSIYFGIVCCILYMLIAGLEPAVVRAGIMAIIGMVGILAGRKTAGGWILLLGSLGMVIIFPLWITDIGFQLSVASMTGVLTIQEPIIHRLRHRLPKFAAEGMGATISAMILTQPLVSHYFGTVSIAAPLINMLVVWMVPILMQIGVVGVITGLIWLEPGQVVLWLAWPFLRIFGGLAEMVSGWPVSSWQIASPGWVVVAGYYGLLISVYWRFNLRRK